MIETPLFAVLYVAESKQCNTAFCIIHIQNAVFHSFHSYFGDLLTLLFVFDLFLYPCIAYILACEVCNYNNNNNNNNNIVQISCDTSG